MQKNNKYQNDWRYAVWVGSVDDLFTDYDIAKKHYDKWIEKGNDDVVLLDLQNNKELYNSEKKEIENGWIRMFILWWRILVGRTTRGLRNMR